jgi:lambda family phage minor tail protein L
MSSETINRELVRLDPDALITLFILDASSLGGGVFRFYPGTDEENNPEPISFQGLQYTPYPLDARGFDYTGQGAPPRPVLMFANILGTFTSLVLQYDDLIGARLTRRRTYRRFLDGQPDADAAQMLPDDIYYVERKVAENRATVEFELTTSMEVDDINLPRRQILANLCLWTYRGTECGYAVHQVRADIHDAILTGTEDPVEWSPMELYTVGSVVWLYAVPPVRRYYLCTADNGGAGIMGESYHPTNTAFWTADQCSKRVQGCRLRFDGDTRGLPFGGFPATARIAR